MCQFSHDEEVPFLKKTVTNKDGQGNRREPGIRPNKNIFVDVFFIGLDRVGRDLFCWTVLPWVKPEMPTKSYG